MNWYKASKVGHDFWSVVTPGGATEETLTGSGAELRIRAIVAERNAELYEDVSPATHHEHDRYQHGDLVIITERRADGTISVRIDPGKEKIEMHMYAKGGVVR